MFSLVVRGDGRLFFTILVYYVLTLLVSCKNTRENLVKKVNFVVKVFKHKVFNVNNKFTVMRDLNGIGLYVGPLRLRFAFRCQ